MNDMNSLKNQAYLIWAEWGPDMIIPRPKRLADCFPQVSEADRVVWLREFSGINVFIAHIVDKGLATVYSADEFANLIREEFPFMDDSSVSKAHFLANYYQWHG